MESLLNRYRNITVLLLVIFAQLVLVAVQVKNDQDVRLVRIWAVTAVTPLARTLEGIRSGTVGVVNNYITLRNADAENRHMKEEVGRLKMENQFLRTELAMAERAKALVAFQEHTPSKTLGARVIGIGTGSGTNSKVVFVDRGSGAGVQRGMGVVTPDGIVGKIVAVYPTASLVELVTDPEFAAGVVSQKNQVRGTLKGQGYATCRVDYVPNEVKVEVGEMFYTAGDDRIFPKGFPAGIVRVVRPGSEFKEILVEPPGVQHGVEEVLILLEGVAQAIPAVQTAATPVYIAPPPPADAAADAPATGAGQPARPALTDADKLVERYRAIGEAQNHTFGVGLPGSKPPDFNIKPPAPGSLPPAPAPASGTAAQGSAASNAPARSAPPAAKPAGSGAANAPAAAPTPARTAPPQSKPPAAKPPSPKPPSPKPPAGAPEPAVSPQ